MFVDARTIAPGGKIETDVCIVGAGAAGVTIARELKGCPYRVAVIESGGFDYSGAVQQLYQGENVGREYMALEACRLRYFGGTTNHWGGTCRPLDESDFEAREWVPYSGWPFSKSHLDPYYERAQPVLQLGPYHYELADWPTEVKRALPLSTNLLNTTFFQQSPPVRFGTAFREELGKDHNVTTYTDATVSNIVTSENGEVVTGLQAMTLEGNTIEIDAQVFVLALGGIEVPRLLLLSNHTMKSGLGNQNDLVGRFFQEHPILQVGTIALSDAATDVELYAKNTLDGTTLKGFLTPTPEAAKSKGLLNFGARPNQANTVKVSKGVASYTQMREELSENEIPDNLFEHITNIIWDVDDVYDRIVNDEKRSLALKFWQETSPNPDSRVMLSPERDRLGQQKVRMDWKLSELDRRTFSSALRMIGGEFGRSGVGRLHLAYDEEELWSDRIAGSCHHMGATRMHDDPKQGVVDKDLKVHGVSNLYISSSSVFPTSGHANPTLTIVALAIRLADHIREVMK